MRRSVQPFWRATGAPSLRPIPQCLMVEYSWLFRDSSSSLHAQGPDPVNTGEIRAERHFTLHPLLIASIPLNLQPVTLAARFEHAEVKPIVADPSGRACCFSRRGLSFGLENS